MNIQSISAIFHSRPDRREIGPRCLSMGAVMSIRFTCMGCRTILKLGEMITEPKKVRCTGCSIVILVEPDPANPMEVIASIPEQNLNKFKSRSEKDLKRRRNILYALGAVLAVGLIFSLWWGLRAPTDRAAIYGEVKLDDDPLARGTITFISQDGKSHSVSGPIIHGSYRLSASAGPLLGPNKVEIRGVRKTGEKRQKPGGAPGELDEVEVEAVHPRYHTESKETVDVKPGSNTKDFLVKSK